MKRIFVVCWYYPPINSSEGLVTYKLLSHSGYGYDVFTQSTNTVWSYGDNANLRNTENVVTVSARADNIDEWVEEAVWYFMDNRDRYAMIMTRSMPPECHMVGLRIKRACPDVPWIASFGDPIKNNPYEFLTCSMYSIDSLKNAINREMPLSRKLSPTRILRCAVWNVQQRDTVKKRRALFKTEDDTMRLCDAVIFNNESQRDYMLRGGKYLEKAYVIPHSYDEDIYPVCEKRQDGKIRFVFTGMFSELRTPLPFLRALALLREDIPDLASRVEVDFYGDLDNGSKIFMIDAALTDIVKINKSIPYKDSLAVMRQADWLIHVDANIGSVTEENIFFAAKIADYFGAGSNIIAITMQKGAAADILREANALVLSYSAEEIKNYLYLIVEEGYDRRLSRDFTARFSAPAVAKGFDTVVKKLDQGLTL